MGNRLYHYWQNGRYLQHSKIQWWSCIAQESVTYPSGKSIRPDANLRTDSRDIPRRDWTVWFCRANLYTGGQIGVWGIFIAYPDLLATYWADLVGQPASRWFLQWYRKQEHTPKIWAIHRMLTIVRSLTISVAAFTLSTAPIGSNMVENWDVIDIEKADLLL